ncbi:MAG: BrnT family toxin [Dehalococcoidia bacterium]|nr:BrnT family toxin [Dehalococcoidia bacterium]
MVYIHSEGGYLMLRIESIEIDDHILEKIESKHAVAFNEVEEACLSERRHVKKSREGLYKLFSQTEAGRYVLVVLVNLGRGSWRVATAREMTDNERRLYIRETGGK